MKTKYSERNFADAAKKANECTRKLRLEQSKLASIAELDQIELKQLREKLQVVEAEVASPSEDIQDNVH